MRRFEGKVRVAHVFVPGSFQMNFPETASEMASKRGHNITGKKINFLTGELKILSIHVEYLVRSNVEYQCFKTL